MKVGTNMTIHALEDDSSKFQDATCDYALYISTEHHVRNGIYSIIFKYE